jgi:hypothetical protein
MTDGLDNLRGTAMWFMDERRLSHWSRLAHGGSAHQRLLVAGGVAWSGLDGDRAERAVGSTKRRRRDWLQLAVADKVRWWMVQVVEQ